MKTNRHTFIIWLLVLILAFSQTASVLAQALPPTKVAAEVLRLKLASKLMAREMPYRVVLPSDYKLKPNERFPVIYLLHGLTGNNTNWTTLTKLAEYAMKHNFVVVTPEGGNGWYSDSAATPNDKYESYIIKELIPEIDKNYRTVAERGGRVIAGLSMGGYGSLKFGLKYPELFSLVGSFSGAIGAAGYSEKTSAAIGRNIDGIFGPIDSETRNANDLFKLVRDLSPERQKELPFIYQSCGTEDFLIKNNRDFLSLLNEKKISHEYREHPGGHNWIFWDDQVREFLAVVERRITKK